MLVECTGNGISECNQIRYQNEENKPDSRSHDILIVFIFHAALQDVYAVSGAIRIMYIAPSIILNLNAERG